jgi:4-hydroxy-tetrahydrodipicolinate reductase
MSRIAVNGAGGRMGRAIIRILLERGHRIAGAYEIPSSSLLGRDAGLVAGLEPIGLSISEMPKSFSSDIELVIDFSSPLASISVANAARAAKTALVMGTTGFTQEERVSIENAGADIPLILAPNMSPGVNLLFRLTEMAARVLNSGYDIEVLESHHRFKKDAPSGTAKKLVEIIRQSSPELVGLSEINDRTVCSREREPSEVGMSVIRGGDIVGEHTVFFIGMGERIELTHRATNRDTLARGAVVAAEFLYRKPPGLYTMYDVLGI